jgi:hypothetical protein
MNDGNNTLSLVLHIEPSGASSDSEQTDMVARKLLRFLRENDFMAELGKQPGGPTGAKSIAAAEIGKVVLTLLPAAIPRLIELVDHWINRDGSNSIRVKLADGTEVEVKGGVAPAALEEFITIARTSAVQPSRKPILGS